MIRLTFYLALLCGAFAQDSDSSGATPINTVIKLIEEIKHEVETEAKEEALFYDKFACFCKDTTMQKSKSVNDGNENIDKLSAKIEDETAQKEEAETDLANRKKKQIQLKGELQDEKNRCAKEKAVYEAAAADLNKAIADLKNAIKALQESKPAEFLQMKASLRKTFEMAEVMNLITTPKHKRVAAFIQTSTGVDPADPEYQFHSDEIIEVCQNLLKEYTENKDDLDEEWGKTSKACKEKIAALTKEIAANLAAMKALSKKIDELKQSIATAREDLVLAKGQMEDDALYLKDLTKRCEDRAHDYDQRSAMRADEIQEITKALGILEGTVKETADEVNVRALVQTGAQAPKPSLRAGKTVLKSISFLQSSSVSSAEEISKDKALSVLKAEGKRLKSLTLLSLVQRAAADPFTKVKVLIQRLIERLLTEAKDEATKKGFCDTELGKAEKDRGFRWEHVNKIAADVQVLQAKELMLTEEIKMLGERLVSLNEALVANADERRESKEEHQKTLKTAKEGLEAVNEALVILRNFYNEAAKAALVQVKASPVDEDTTGPGFSGTYQGKQEGSNAVLALLETIASDFDRTIRMTEQAEKMEAELYVKSERSTKEDISAKSTKKELDEQDLQTTSYRLDTARADLKTNMDLVDAAVKTLMDLKPTCIDTSMSYKDRVAKREEEIEALKKALCILDTESVEPDCGGMPVKKVPLT